MSWAEVKKINSDLSTPLDTLSKIQHINLIGNSYVPTTEDAISILKHSSVYSNPIALSVVSSVFWQNLYYAQNNVGNYISSAFSISNSALSGVSTFSQLLNSAEAMFELGNSYGVYRSVLSTNNVYDTLLNTSNSPYVRGMMYNPTVFQDAFLVSANNPKILSAYRIRNIENSLNAVRSATTLYTSGSGSYTFSNDVSGAFVVCIGGGGGGGGGNASFVAVRSSGSGGSACGFGGGSGTFLIARIGVGGAGGGIAQAFVLPNYSYGYNYSVGNGGLGGATSNGSVAGSGGDTYFANDVINFSTTNRSNTNYNYINSSLGGYWSSGYALETTGNSGINGGNPSNYKYNNTTGSGGAGGGWGGGNGATYNASIGGIGGATLSSSVGGGNNTPATSAGGAGGGFGGGGAGGGAYGDVGGAGGTGCIAILRGLPFNSL